MEKFAKFYYLANYSVEHMWIACGYCVDNKTISIIFKFYIRELYFNFIYSIQLP